MPPSLVALSPDELAETNGGNPVILVPVVAVAWHNLLNKIEQNPSDYTFLMDWFYDTNG